jgi:hypothetical protein
MPNAEHLASEHLAQNHAQFDAIERSVAEIREAIGATQAVAVTLRKYGSDKPDLSADSKKTMAGTLDDAAREAQAIENELDLVRKDIQIGRDLAGIGDDSIAVAREARQQLKAAEDAEHKVLAGFASASRDRGKSQNLAALGDRAARLADHLDQTEHELDAIVEQGLQEAKVTLAQTKAELDGYKAELIEHETETRSIGSSVLGASFKEVKAKLYDIVIRSDVGNVDVSWSQREDTDDDLKRLNLSRQRELKQLKDEFKDILDAGTQKPSAPAKKLEVPQAAPNPPSGSPDKGGPDQRIVPGSDKPGTPAPPTVRPGDAQKKDPKKPEPKKPDPKKAGAAKGGVR